MLKAILFDMDGVIADTEPLHFLSVKKTMEEYNINLSNDLLKEFIGMCESGIWKLVKKRYDINLPIDVLERKRRIHLLKIIKEEVIPAKGLIPLLKEIKKANLKTALVSSSGRQVIDEILKKLKLTGYFDVIVSGNDVTDKKPHSEPYIKAMKTISVLPNECIAIEDSDKGITSARNAGIFTCGLLIYSMADTLQGDKNIHSLDELNIEKLKKIVEK
jgi:HAD superfamily hydrolase (TIGR01509 family)